MCTLHHGVVKTYKVRGEKNVFSAYSLFFAFNATHSPSSDLFIVCVIYYEMLHLCDILLKHEYEIKAVGFVLCISLCTSLKYS